MPHFFLFFLGFYKASFSLSLSFSLSQFKIDLGRFNPVKCYQLNKQTHFTVKMLSKGYFIVPIAMYGCFTLTEIKWDSPGVLIAMYLTHFIYKYNKQ